MLKEKQQQQQQKKTFWLHSQRSRVQSWRLCIPVCSIREVRQTLQGFQAILWSIPDIVGLYEMEQTLVKQVTRQSRLLSVNLADAESKALSVECENSQDDSPEVAEQDKNTKCLEGPLAPPREAKWKRLWQGHRCVTFETISTQLQRDRKLHKCVKNCEQWLFYCLILLLYGSLLCDNHFDNFWVTTYNIKQYSTRPQAE